MSNVRVQPVNKDLVVLDSHSRRIPWEEKGVEVKKTIHVVRLIKSGDLTDMDAAVKKEAVAIKESKKGGK